MVAAFLAVAGIALWFTLGGQESGDRETIDRLNGRERLVLLDGSELNETTVSPGAGDGLRVIVWLDDKVLADLPFGEEHTLEVLQKSGRNKIRITKDKVYMEEADCPGQDCIGMGSYTRENWDVRPQWIVCLPHKLSIQVTD